MSARELTPLERAIAALRQARRRIEALEQGRDEAIAVVAMACRLPGCDGIDALWELVCESRDAIDEVPPTRWSLDGLGPELRRGGFVDHGVLDFDPERFGLAEREVEDMDPQQRLLLEVASVALEQAGDAELAGSDTGVFLGISTNDYAQRSLRDDDLSAIGPYTGTGNAFSAAAGRVAYLFGLEGPCMAVDTACSSVLVALHLACQSLRARDCDRALVAGVNALLAPAMSVYFSRLGVLAPDGVCRAFDADARGYARAEGCGALVLRRLDDALRMGDPIRGVIRATAINANGQRNGLTGPSRAAQARVIRRALARARLEPEAIAYVEAFGAGTPVGDAVELRALTDVFEGRPRGDLPIASIKTNIGHTEAASGAASLIRTLLCLEHGELPPSLHCARPSPILSASPLRVVRELEPWPPDKPRLAGVSGFGFGGTNAHVVLEAAPPAEAVDEPEGPALLVLSARTSTALEQRRIALANMLVAPAGLSLAKLVRAQAAQRDHAHRLALVCADLERARVELADGRRLIRGEVGEPPRVILRCAAGPMPVDALFTKLPPGRELLEQVIETTAGEDRAELAALLAADASVADEQLQVRGRTATRAVHAAALRTWSALGVRPVQIVGDDAEEIAALAGFTEARGRPGGASVEIDLARPSLLEQLAQLYVRGLAPRWEVLVGPGPRVALPPQPFERRPIATRGPITAPANDRRAGLGAALRSEAPDRRRERLGRWLGDRIGALLGRELPRGRAIADLGLDSLAVIELIQQVQRELGVVLYPRELLAASSLAALAERLARELGRSEGDADAPARADPDARARVRAHLDARRVTKPPAHPSDFQRLPGAVFVLSAPRSGSTLLRAMLAGHGQLFAPPELHLLAHDDMASWQRSLAPRMLHLGLVQALIGAGLDPAAAAAQLDAWVAAATPTATVYAELQALVPGRRLVDKSPGHALDPRALARAEQLFDGPRYVILTRHPYAVIESFTRLRMGQLFDAEELDAHLLGEEIWARSYAALAELEAGVGATRCHRLAFEELVRAPEATMRELCEFLGLRFEPATLHPFAGDRMVDGQRRAIGFIGDPNFATRSHIDPTLGERWRPLRLPWRLADATVARAHALGYETPAETTTRDTEQVTELDMARADAVLPAPLIVAPATGTDEGELLLTGATGFLGVHLAAELLRQTARPLRCLVRADDDSHARARVLAAMQAFDLWQPDWDARVRAEPADLAAPDLGLDRRRFDRLADSSCAIYHNAARVHFGLPYAALRGPNVIGTAAMLRLAAAGRHTPLHFVSTKGVYTSEAYPGDVTIAEDDPVLPPLAGLAYQLSKWAAEQLVSAAREHGLATAIYRPGRIGGQSDTGHVNPEDLLCQLIRACVQVGSLPEVELPLELVPVDHVAAAIVRVSLRADAPGRAYNLAHAEPEPIVVVADALAARGLELARVPWRSWRDAVRARSDSPLATLHELLGDAPPARVDERRFARANLRALDPDWAPPPVLAQLRRDLAFMARIGLLGGPPR